MLKNTLLGRLFKKVQVQGGEEVRSEAYLDVRCNDERPRSPPPASFARASLGEVRKGDVSPSEESLRRRWAFFSSLLGLAPAEHIEGHHPFVFPFDS